MTPLTFARKNPDHFNDNNRITSASDLSKISLIYEGITKLVKKIVKEINSKILRGKLKDFPREFRSDKNVRLRALSDFRRTIQREEVPDFPGRAPGGTEYRHKFMLSTPEIILSQFLSIK